MAKARVISLAIERIQLDGLSSPNTIYKVPEQLLSQSKIANYSCLMQLSRSAFLEYRETIAVLLVKAAPVVGKIVT